LLHAQGTPADAHDEAAPHRIFLRLAQPQADPGGEPFQWVFQPLEFDRNRLDEGILERMRGCF
jgi:hypothetical protein